MITVFGSHVVIEVSGISAEKVSKKDFNKSIDEICIALKKNADDIKHYVDNYPNSHFSKGHQLRIYK
ncbi:hypothetical protein [Peribacillus sp. NPDC055009]